MATPKRKPLGNAQRFKILQRDGFRCQYCGGVPPAAVLHVDHVVPVVDGGGNDDANLVAACSNCNHGKFTRSVEAESIPRDYASLASNAKERSRQLRAYQAHLAELRKAIDDAIDFVGKAYWNGNLTWNYEHATKERAQTERFINLLGLADVEHAARIAHQKFDDNPRSRFRYFAGICWRMATERGLRKEDHAR